MTTITTEAIAGVADLKAGYQLSFSQAEGYRWGWNACRAATLAAAPTPTRE